MTAGRQDEHGRLKAPVIAQTDLRSQKCLDGFARPQAAVGPRKNRIERFYIAEGNFSRPQFFRGSTPFGGEFAVGYSPRTEWLDVCSRKKRGGKPHPTGFTGSYECAGFNLYERCWSYSDGPDGAQEIIQFIDELFVAKE